MKEPRLGGTEPGLSNAASAARGSAPNKQDLLRVTLEAIRLRRSHSSSPSGGGPALAGPWGLTEA